MTIWVVTGRSRTGTSVMMDAIASSSTLNVIRDSGFEAAIKAREVSKDYSANPNGFFAAPPNVLPDDVVNGSLLKCDIFKWEFVEPGLKIRVVRMIRDETERLASMLAAFGAKPPDSGTMNFIHRNEYLLECLPQESIMLVNYKDLIENPTAVFQRLADAGWPIDVEIASSKVDPTLYRNRY